MAIASTGVVRLLKCFCVCVYVCVHAGGLCAGAFSLEPAGPPAVLGSCELRPGCNQAISQQSRLEQIHKTVSVTTPDCNSNVKMTLMPMHENHCLFNQREYIKNLFTENVPNSFSWL